LQFPLLWIPVQSELSKMDTPNAIAFGTLIIYNCIWRSMVALMLMLMLRLQSGWRIKHDESGPRHGVSLCPALPGVRPAQSSRALVDAQRDSERHNVAFKARNMKRRFRFEAHEGSRFNLHGQRFAIRTGVHWPSTHNIWGSRRFRSLLQMWMPNPKQRFHETVGAKPPTLHRRNLRLLLLLCDSAVCLRRVVKSGEDPFSERQTAGRIQHSDVSESVSMASC